LIVVDSSALIAILLREPDAQLFASRINGETSCLISAANYVETGQVFVQRLGQQPDVTLAQFHTLLERSNIAIAPIDEAQARAALQARLVYGRGFGHRAGLNYSDCFAYALAKVRGLPLLFKGDDFTHTDIVSALL
jgi:ribonuclease VapC